MEDMDAKKGYTINVRGRLVDLSKPLVMGILNVTSDSFYQGSRKQTEVEIAQHTSQIIEEGGEMIDAGAFSTRPGGAFEVTEEEEMDRLRRALVIVRRERPEAIISVDTYRPRVAHRCAEEWGADIISDVSEGGLTGIINIPIHEEGSMFETVARLQVPYVLMSVEPNLHDMLVAFTGETQKLYALGTKDIILDPGFGFGKTLDESYKIYHHMGRLQVLGLPLLVGISRKSMIYKLLGGDPITSLNGTTVLDTTALQEGAAILHVHDVREAVEACKTYERMQGV